MEANGHFFYSRCTNDGDDIKFNLWKVNAESQDPSTQSLIKGKLDSNIVITKMKSGDITEFKIDFIIIPKDDSGFVWPPRAFSKIVPIKIKSILESPTGAIYRPCDLLCLLEVNKNKEEVNAYYRYWFATPLVNRNAEDGAIVVQA